MSARGEQGTNGRKIIAFRRCSFRRKLFLLFFEQCFYYFFLLFSPYAFHLHSHFLPFPLSTFIFPTCLFFFSSFSLLLLSFHFFSLFSSFHFSCFLCIALFSPSSTFPSSNFFLPAYGAQLPFLTLPSEDTFQANLWRRCATIEIEGWTLICFITNL